MSKKKVKTIQSILDEHKKKMEALIKKRKKIISNFQKKIDKHQK